MKRELRWLVLSGLVVVAGMAALLWVQRSLRQAGPAAEPLPAIAQVGTFTVTNQAGVTLTEKDLEGRPWAINLIFTRCPGPCAVLTGVMRSIQDQLPSGSRAGLISITSDPEFDTPAVLSEYAHRFGADTSRWHFVTADRAAIRRLATEQLLLVLQEIPEERRESENDLFLHSTLIVLVDGKGQMRAAIEGLAPGAAEKALQGLRRLERGE